MARTARYLVALAFAAVPIEASAVEFKTALSCAYVGVSYEFGALASQQRCFKLVNNCTDPVSLRIDDHGVKRSTSMTQPGDHDTVCGHQGSMTDGFNIFRR